MASNYAHQRYAPMVTPKRMFKAMVHDSHHVLPQAVPGAIKGIYYAQGNGEVGSIRVTEFVEGQQVKYLKHRIDHVDEVNMVYRYTLIDGAWIHGRMESVTNEIKFESWGNGGCVLKMTHLCHKMECYNHVEQYLVNNPRLCHY